MTDDEKGDEVKRFTVYARTYSPYPGGSPSWRQVTTKNSMFDAMEARDRYQRANPGAQLKIGDPDEVYQAWTVYGLQPSGAWRSFSTWDDVVKAQTALRVKRLQDPDGVYEVYPDGQAPDPDADQADIEGARERRRRAEEVARRILAERQADPDRCRARKPGQEDIRGLCVGTTGHRVTGPGGGHETAYEAALRVLRDEEEGISGYPAGGQSGARGFQPQRSSREMRVMFKPDRPGDPGEEPDEDVTPAGDGFAPGAPLGRHRAPDDEGRDTREEDA